MIPVLPLLAVATDVVEPFFDTDAWPYATIEATAGFYSADGGGQTLGSGVARIGDFDGDGRPDLLIGANRADRITKPVEDGINTGAVLLVPGSRFCPDREATLPEADFPHLYGSSANARLGEVVRDLGSIDRDHRSEVLISAWGLDPEGVTAGTVHLVQGSSLGWADGSLVDEILGEATVVNPTADDAFGRVIDACDPDGGGPAIIASAPRSAADPCGDPVDGDYGAILMLRDLPAALAEGRSADACAWPVASSWWDAESPQVRLGYEVSCSGDLDGDGWPDLVATTSHAGSGNTCAIAKGCPGYVTIWNGGPGMMQGDAATSASNRFTWTADLGEVPDLVVGPAGDLDGDGRDDLAVGILNHACDSCLEADQSACGAVAIYYSSGTLDQAGPRDLVADADLLVCGTAGEGWLGHSLSSEGDVNGDGIDDLVVTRNNDGADRKDQIYVVYGIEGGLAGIVDVGDVSPSRIRAYVDGAEYDNSYLGHRLDVADMDLDGIDDIIAGASQVMGSDGVKDRGVVWVFYGAPDLDSDGWFAGPTGTDCDDADPDVHPAGVEITGDGTDSDCDGFDQPTTCDGKTIDCDGDGVATPADCDDAEMRRLPGATEVDNGRDDDCDGQTDEGTAGADADGDGWTLRQGDCDDTDPNVHPCGDEGSTADGVNQDCDLASDEGTAGYDDDGDGWAEPEDCDDASLTISPDITEVCNGIDDDCDGLVDEADAADAATWFPDDDGDIHGDPREPLVACAQPAGYISDATDCDDADAGVFPGAIEICDDTDDDCDGETDEGWDADSDGWSACGGDCDDSDPEIHPGAVGFSPEDLDCDGSPNQLQPCGCGSGPFIPRVSFLVLLGLAARRRLHARSALRLRRSDPRGHRGAGP